MRLGRMLGAGWLGRGSQGRGWLGTAWLGRGCLLGTLTLLSTSCSSTPLMRVKSPTPTAEPPHLERVVDLGGLDLAATGALPEEESDGVATPGEWLALIGSGLTGPDGVVRFGKQQAQVGGYTSGGGLLVRVPRGLGPSVDVSVKTKLGEASLPITIQSYVAVTDVGASKLRFIRAEGAKLGDELEGLDVKGLRASTMSSDGALLYAISAKPVAKGGGYRLVAVHMGAKTLPDIASDYEMPLDGAPTALALSADDRRLFVLTEKSLAVYELDHRITPRARGVLLLSPATAGAQSSARSLVVLAGGKRAAVLDALGDRLLLVDTAGAPALVASLDVRPPGSTANTPPTSFDIVGDDADPNAVWLLSGPNSRFATHFLADLSDGIRKLLGATSEKPADQTANEPGVSWPAPLLRRFVFEGSAGREASRVDLPKDFLPLHLAQGPRAALWVSGLASDWSHVSSDPASVVRALTSTTEVGRVLEIDPAGHVSTRLSGLLAVFALTKFPANDTPLYTAMRFGASFEPGELVTLSAPVGVSVKWVAESYKQGSVPLRAVEWTSILPPYLPPSVLAQ